MLALDLDCLVAVLPWIWFEFLGFFGFLRDVNLGFGLLLDFLDWIWISFGLDWIRNPKVGLEDSNQRPELPCGPALPTTWVVATLTPRGLVGRKSQMRGLALALNVRETNQVNHATAK